MGREVQKREIRGKRSISNNVYEEGVQEALVFCHVDA